MECPPLLVLSFFVFCDWISFMATILQLKVDFLKRWAWSAEYTNSLSFWPTYHRQSTDIPSRINGQRIRVSECWLQYRPRYLPIVDQYVDHHSADISVDTSVYTSTDTSLSTYRPILGRYVDRHIGWHSADMSTNRSVECRSICRPRCRPIYRSRGAQNTHDPSFVDNLVEERYSHNEDTTGTFTLFSRSWEIPFKADLCFKPFLFSVFSINLFVMTFFSTRLFLLFLVVALCSLSSCSFEATVLSAFSTCHKHKKINFQFNQKWKWQIFELRFLLNLFTLICFYMDYENTQGTESCIVLAHPNRQGGAMLASRD